MRFWIDDLRNPRDYVQDWGKDDDIWSKSYEEFMIHLQIHVQGDQRIGHIYFDYNLGTGGTGLDCAMLVTSKDWEWALDDHLQKMIHTRMLLKESFQNVLRFGKSWKNLQTS